MMVRLLVAVGSLVLFTGAQVKLCCVRVQPEAELLSTAYPGDVGIEGNSDVLFVEHFEEATTGDVCAHWGDCRVSYDPDFPEGPLPSHATAFFSTDIPTGAPGGSHSFKTVRSNPTTIPGGDNGALLYTHFAGQQILYVRYYTKYADNAPHHSGVWMGGYNPPENFPVPCANCLPTGNERFSIAPELHSSGLFQLYAYWMGMRPDGVGSFYGNVLIGATPGVTITINQWLCVEQRLKLNNPLGASNGEHTLWLDGVQRSHLGQNTPNGTWTSSIFNQNPMGAEVFPGFRWTNATDLDIDWIWLQNYIAPEEATLEAIVYFDQVVVAKRRIGCIS